MDQRLRETIDYAVCLNSIGSSSNELWLHVSKPPENAYIKQIFEVTPFPSCEKQSELSSDSYNLFVMLSGLYTIFMQGFSSVSEELGLKVGLKHKKINISDPRVSIFPLFKLTT